MRFPLPETSESVAIDDQSCNDVWIAVRSISEQIHDSEVITKQACYKAQLRLCGEDEEVEPMVGPAGIKGLWLAKGHDKRGRPNAPGTGLAVCEMMFAGAAHSANCGPQNPKHFLKEDWLWTNFANVLKPLAPSDQQALTVRVTILEQVDVSIIRVCQQLRMSLLLNIDTAVRISQNLIMFNFPTQKMSQTRGL